MPNRVAFLGLGVMGYPMAGHLAQAGHHVTVYNRNAAKSAGWVAEHGGVAAPTPADAARDAEFVLMCVGNDNDVRAVATGPAGALGAMRAGRKSFGWGSGAGGTRVSAPSLLKINRRGRARAAARASSGAAGD